MTASQLTSAVTADAFLGDRLVIEQPASGYRAGVDAVLLAASAPAAPGGKLSYADCGAGVGTVGLCIAARCPDAHVVLVEREPDLVALAEGNIARNGLGARCTVAAGDVTANALHASAPKIEPDSIDHALANPPFNIQGGGTPAQDRLKSASHAMASDDLDLWVRFMTRIVRPGGTATMIHKAGMIGRLLEAFAGRFGGLFVLPIHPYEDQPAIRILVQGTKGSRADAKILPGLVLHQPDQSFRTFPKSIFRDGAALDLARWPNSAAGST